MKSGCVVAFCIFVAVCGAIGLYLLSLNPPDPVTTDPHVIPEPKPEPKPDPDKYLSVRSLNEFKRIETSDAYRVSYGFIDYSGQTHRISCNIKKDDYKRETDSYGYDDALLDRLSAQKLSEFFNREIQGLGLASYIKLQFPGAGRYQWEYRIPGNTPGLADIERQIKRYFSAFEERVKERYHIVMNQLLNDRGFQMNDYLISINYRDLVLKGQQPLMDCYQNLKNSAKNYNQRQYLGLFLAFMQEIQYQVPPNLVNGKQTIGLWVPTEVVSNNHGDCDSKSVAFSSIVKSHGLSSVVIHVPKHVLVGVESKPGPDQEFVRIGNRYFILCEVAGPGKWAPGNEGDDDVKGSFRYHLIEPADTI